MFQSTPPRGRRLRRRGGRPRHLHVSIHASAREATGKAAQVPARGRVSIHASAREATRPRRPLRAGRCSFNPRLRAGGDLDALVSPLDELVVSIHASAREATTALDNAHNATAGFNPRLRAGGDPRRVEQVSLAHGVSIHASAREATDRLYGWCSIRPSFNPRLRAGGDLVGLRVRADDERFNPRLRAGGDPDQVVPRLAGHVSIHASAREAAVVTGWTTARTRVSIHASAQEATWRAATSWRRPKSFNPRLRAGGDGGDGQHGVVGGRVSIHASAREATGAQEMSRLRLEVSIHASAREATG